jgi:hypothetical protein
MTAALYPHSWPWPSRSHSGQKDKDGSASYSMATGIRPTRVFSIRSSSASGGGIAQQFSFSCIDGGKSPCAFRYSHSSRDNGPA